MITDNKKQVEPVSKEQMEKMVALELRLDEFDKNLEIMAKKVVYTILYFSTTKFEQKSNDRYLATIILNSMIQDQQFIMYINKRAKEVALEVVESKINAMKLALDQKISS